MTPEREAELRRRVQKTCAKCILEGPDDTCSYCPRILALVIAVEEEARAAERAAFEKAATRPARGES